MGADMRQLTARGTITLPKRAIADVGAEAGTWFEVTSDGARISLTPKQFDDRFSDAEWGKLQTLIEGPRKAYRSAAGAKKHVRGLGT
jgi:hypothetical protein